MNTPIESQIEAMLFYKGEPIKMSALAQSLSITDEEAKDAVYTLKASLENRGVRVVLEGECVGLATAPDVSSLIAKMRKEELEGPLGKAGLETLAIIIYQGSSTRADIEYIRGVNCSSILRSLTIRGLIERIENPQDKRSFLYRPTTELPATLGVSSLSDLPQFDEFKKMIDDTLAQKDDVESKEETL
ncbi:hypothetical protein COU15_00210 [Candidatus Kaiserbacteria bacterium CG10_big_fil_rev_8_21_14_0_10_45_20]|uniref:SMC-Scp complex subunit ScpB n=1 Tax=Candidatus Kaiserbacteria bacterium CG10_big_fil_rev_8_21_14_0_10_45_20 TaxID=1974607 RepID=A0A2H0UI88_9BACT|nr:MAG: hypothetical protein COU15_00210 [Candidatus Kaiserbacteria bacterium CG10_big_fil_rev_8_21_14_0_10_45_20]